MNFSSKILWLLATTQAFLPSFLPVLDLLVYVLPFFSSTWLPPLLSYTYFFQPASLAPFLYINFQFVSTS